MRSKEIYSLFITFILIGSILSAGFVNAQVVRPENAETSGNPFSGNRLGSASFVSSKTMTGPDLKTYYAGDSRLSTYYPILNEKDASECKVRQDILLMQVPPAGCEPAVVRSDLLAEQNVPVFCKISALKVNPLVDIKQIKNIRFTGEYPAEVAGVGFHPAQAALNTRDILTGSPVMNNIGYVVVVLKQQEKEEDLPELINLTLSASLEYDAGNAIGVGKASFLLEPVSDDKWKVERNRNSFFKGRYFLKLESLNENHAVISVYYGDEKLATRDVKKGETSSEIYVPGFYCQVALNIAYDGFIGANDIARISVDDNEFDVYEGSYFLDNKCRVVDIKPDTTKVIDASGAETILPGRTGSVDIACGGKGSTLKLSAKGFLAGDEVRIVDDKGKEQDTIYVISKTKEEKGKRTYNLKELDCVSSKPCEIAGEFPAEKLRPANPNKLYEVKYDADTEKYFENAIKEYERVADEYPLEKENGFGNSPAYGENALKNAIQLAEEMNKQATEARLINKYIKLYPGGEDARRYNQRLNDIYDTDFSLSGNIIEIDNKRTVIRLIDIRTPEKKASAMFSLGSGASFEAELGKKTDNGRIPAEGRLKYVTLNEISGTESARATLFCINGKEESGIDKYDTSSVTLSAGVPVKICGDSQIIKLEYINTKEYGKIRIEPVAKGAETQTNLSVGIGIEKRAIQLTPEQIYLKLRNLNESIKKWEEISEKLGNVVKTMKAACLATSVVLTVKNFFGGLSGKSAARQEVMRGAGGWTEYCTQNKAKHGGSIVKCYNDNAQEINKDVEARANAIEKTNSVIKSIEAGCSKSTSGFFGGKVIERDKCTKDLIEKIKADYGTEDSGVVDSQKNKLTVREVLKDSSSTSYTEARDMYSNLAQKKSGSMSVRGSENVENKIKGFAQNVLDRESYNKQTATLNSWLAEKGNKLTSAYTPSYGSKGSIVGEYHGWEISSGDITGVETWTGGGTKAAQTMNVNNKPYLVLLEKTSGGSYVISGGDKKDFQIYELQEATSGNEKYTATKIKDSAKSAIEGVQFQSFTRVDASSLRNNVYKDPEARYFESEPYKGMPALVPFDLDNGWYAATKQTLPSFGGIKAFEANGRPVSFWICNIGTNGKEEFNSGKDNCRQFNLNTGQPLEFFSGLSNEQTEVLVDKAINALQSAAEQYGAKYIRINGYSIKVGMPASSTPGTQCQDFMSPAECKLLFNVCDPVVCPNSRCDLGGTYHSANVIQEGIVGGLALCLPNFKEGIYIPFCLSGIKAGLDGLLSVMKSHYACLMENIKTGRMTGTCDEIYSFYYCELFWRNIGPIANTLLPKLIGMAYGSGGVRGGGEYLTTTSAWENAQQSMKYFTQEYAVNSFQAFKIGSVAEAGTTFCKAFMSSKTPKSFESLIEPDSPAQFHAWFSSIRYSDATVPATAQYKVFYHIFAGNDEGGVGYSVYLKDPPATSYYQSTPVVQVASGFIAPGEYATETKDFTAPEGYQQLCVSINGKEECGFKQVSSSYAVNAVRDEFVQQEINRTDIVGEKECIAGGQSIGALLQPNLQAGLEETAFPEVYNRGVARICSTENPGKGTDLARFVEVGVCDDSKIKCWVDKKSVDNAITDKNIGAKTEATADLTATQLAKLKIDNGNIIFNQEQFNQAVKPLNEKMNEIVYTKGKSSGAYNDKIIMGDVEALSLQMENVLGNLFYNKDKASLILKKGDLWAGAARAKMGFGRITAPVKEEVKAVEKDIAPAEEPKEKEESIAEQVTGTEKITSLNLGVTWLGLGNKLQVLDPTGKGTNIYIYPKTNEVFFDNSLLGFGKNVKLGDVIVDEEKGKIIKLEGNLDIDKVGVADGNKWILGRLNGVGVDIGKRELSLNYEGGSGSVAEELDRGEEVADEVVGTEAPDNQDKKLPSNFVENLISCPSGVKTDLKNDKTTCLTAVETSTIKPSDMSSGAAAKSLTFAIDNPIPQKNIKICPNNAEKSVIGLGIDNEYFENSQSYAYRTHIAKITETKEDGEVTAKSYDESSTAEISRLSLNQKTFSVPFSMLNKNNKYGTYFIITLKQEEVSYQHLRYLEFSVDNEGCMTDFIDDTQTWGEPYKIFSPFSKNKNKFCSKWGVFGFGLNQDNFKGQTFNYIVKIDGTSQKLAYINDLFPKVSEKIGNYPFSMYALSDTQYINPIASAEIVISGGNKECVELKNLNIYPKLN